MTAIQEFFNTLEKSIQDEYFVKIHLTNYKGTDKALKKVIVKCILIKNVLKLNIVYRHLTKDITKNNTIEEGFVLLKNYIQKEGFRQAMLFTTQNDFILEYQKNGQFRLRKQSPSHKTPPPKTHNRAKQRKIDHTTKPIYLEMLGIMDKQAKVYKHAQNKYKQINHYIELLSSLLEKLPAKDMIQVADMGCGKGYLTFALYDYLQNKLNKQTAIVGVEYRQELVDFCNQTAQKCHFDHLSFVQNTIINYSPKEIDILVALHACDTATDDAIAKGIDYQADLIVVAPCCHKQVRSEIQNREIEHGLDALLKYGVFMERQAEMLTDALRMLVLNYFGYTTKALEFVSDAHTPKNVLIIAKKNAQAAKEQVILEKIKTLKQTFGISQHYLETRMGI